MSSTSQPNNDQPIGRRISRMDSKTAKSISSGQVITSLTNVVKELLENAMDAKATVITLRFKEMGKDLIEVTDNGFGISQQDLDSLAKRHCTSKLSDFEDLSSISSFGFRGEALNSLCLLSDVSIQTRHSSDPIGTHLKFDSEANIKSRLSIARTVGTVVSVENLFHNIPVRKKEFLTNIKREFDKMVRLVYGYCIGSVGLRITLTNQMTNKNKQTVLSSPGISIRNNINEVFDLKQTNCLLEFRQNSKSIPDLNCDQNIEISGFISKSDSGCGRSASDRQFFYVNGRPCDMKNISKFINDIYRSYNKNQFPFVLLNIKIDKNCVDFNLSPDKRQLLIANEDKIFSIIKQTIVKLFTKENSCPLDSMTNYVTTSVNRQFSQKRKDMTDVEVESLMSSPLKVSRCRSPCDSPFNKITVRDSIVKTPSDLIKSLDSPMTSTPVPKSFTSAKNVMNEQLIRSPKTSEFVSQDCPKHYSRNTKQFKKQLDFSIEDIPKDIADIESQGLEPFDSTEKFQENDDLEEKPSLDPLITFIRPVNKSLTEIEMVLDSDEDQDINESQYLPKTSTQNTEAMDNTNSKTNDEMYSTVVTSESFFSTITDIRPNDSSSCQTIDETKKTVTTSKSISSSNATDIPPNDSSSYQTNDITIDTDCDEIKQLFLKSTETNELTNEYKFSAKITNSQNQRAEQELSNELKKNSFDEMEVIGQFNEGFIITKLDRNLFIVDQHASNERYNFETLLNNTPIESQNLVVPMPLELSAANEQVVIEHLNTFKKLGFGIVVNETAPPGHRIHLSGIPISKEWTAGKQDVEEIVGKIIDTPIELLKDYKLENFKRVIASRACRSSVMIGTSLFMSQMKLIISQMSQLKNPWHCAHNRPTIRHLIDLTDILSLNSNN